MPVTIEKTGVRFDPKVIENKSLSLDCPAVGLPIPKIAWFKDNEEIDFKANPHITLKLNGRQLLIKSAKVEDAGTYECRATNEAGNDQISYEIEVWGKKAFCTTNDID